MRRFIFDIGGVLVNFNYRKLAKDFAVMTECRHELIQKLFDKEMLYMIETGRLPCDEFYSIHIKGAMPTLSYEQWIEMFREHFVLNPPGFDLLQRLKNKGKKTYLLSNLAEFHKIAIERRYPYLFKICERNFFSYEMGFHKPEPQIFQTVCLSLGENPENCIFIDDLKENVEGAKSAGLMAVHYSNDRILEIADKLMSL
ncbi:putative hydrolase of the HAD superfamily [Anaerobacterium chartisolvens]|uniref:Putative hydrolase of the HAD superfamily n=1 Tax=Anaerobacterium chartisolvens TaxID=1297424 RepID=A0A369AZV1_9FIRM|nr:HAD family phosphatase [Anaerobacterium chartisolvens]RCX14809.1 putative hydrolase of the HAD superfamily [Anaerobacterium chartisolvens]